MSAVLVIAVELFFKMWSNLNCAKPHNPDMLSAYSANPGIWHDGVTRTPVSPARRMSDFDSSHTQIMIYATRLLLRNCKQ